MKPRIIYFIPAVIWFAICVILLTLPGKEIPTISWMEFYQADKVVHIIMFFLLCFLFSFPLKNSNKKYSLILMIALTGLSFGIAMEFVQKYFIPFRTCDVDDMIADGIGCLIAYLLCMRLFKKSDSQYL